MATAAIQALIIYGCLYPFRFHAHALGASPLSVLIHSWPVGPTRRIVADGLLNVLLYLPLGFFAQASAGNRRPWLSAAGIVAAAATLSASIEMAQLFDMTRRCSALDTTMNVTGTVLGVAGALVARRWLQCTWRPLPLDAVVLFLLWVGWQLWPLIPQISIPATRLKVRGLFAAPFSVRAFADLAAGAFALGFLAEAIFGERRARWLLAGALCLVPAGLVITGRSLTLAELAGAAAGWALWHSAGHGLKRHQWLAPLLFIAAIVISGLLGYSRGAPPGPFYWTPFQFVNEADPSVALIIVLRKAFLYGSAAWMLHGLGSSYLAAGVSVAALLAVIEEAQMHIPGRVADVTDPILAVLVTGVLYCLEGRATETGAPSARQEIRRR